MDSTQLTNSASADYVEVSGSSSTRFAFGRNWMGFLSKLTEERVTQAEQSLRDLLGMQQLAGKRFLDAGSGSGLSSLAAYRLRARVTSFDLDPECVECTTELRSRFASEPQRWCVMQGSLLDREFLTGLGDFDVVYCWGVAHHTGQLWQAIEGLLGCVTPCGQLVLAIYNDQQHISRAWRAVKRAYQTLPRILRPVYVVVIGTGLFGRRAAVTLFAVVTRLVTLRNPFSPIANWIRESKGRGMHFWHDLVDWVGGWPYEVARPEEVFRYMRDRGFQLREMTTSAGHGCNEFVFVRGRESA